MSLQRIHYAVVHFEPGLNGLDEENCAHVDEQEVVWRSGWDVVDNGAEEEDAEDVNQWEEDWDDSEKSDDFTRQLRAELEKFA